MRNARGVVSGVCRRAAGWALACLCPVAGVAVEATWTGTVAQADYADAAGWRDRTTGEALAVAPTNAGDVAAFDQTDRLRTLRLPSLLSPATNALGTLRGGWQTQLKTYDLNDKNSVQRYAYWFDDVSAFEGAIVPGRSFATFGFTGAASDVHVADLSAALRPTVSVPAGVTVTVDSLRDPGALAKAGAGTLRLGESASADSLIVYHDAGRLELVGHPDGVVAVPGDPVFWVDASAEDSLELDAPDADGRRAVVRWRDRRWKDGAHGLAATPFASHPSPWLAATRVNGRPAVDFGSLASNGVAVSEAALARNGPAAALGYTLPDDVQEFFFVWRDVTEDGAADATVLGQTGAYELVRGEKGSLYSGVTDTRARYGLRRLDGRTAASDTVPAGGRWHMHGNVLVDGGLRPNTFFRDRTVRCGGGRLAEALFYTNVLTAAARGRVERYLREKWFGDHADAEVLRTAGEATPVCVPEGNVARVRQCVVGGAKLVKEGEGVLAVGRFQPASPAIDVAGGAVAFDKDQATASADAPADGAAIWLDATKETSFEYADDAGTSIARWNDCRDGGTAFASTWTGANAPFISRDTCGGRRVVDFGEAADAATRAAMRLSVKSVREAFQVVKLPVKGSQQNIFGCGGQNLLRARTTGLLHRQWAYFAPVAGLWTMNGETVDPYGDYSVDSDTWYVASFSSSDACVCDRLASERDLTVGDQRIGEFIGYDRCLSDDERRQTVAYLLKKWKGVDDAYARPPSAIGQMNFTAANASPTVVADVATEIGRVTFAGQSTFTKKGAGALVIGGGMPRDVAAYDVEGACTVSEPLALFPDAALHCDAACAASFTFDGAAADGRIDRWRDCRGNGLYAKSVLDETKSWTNRAVRTAAGDAGEGGLLSGRPYVDFGADCGGMYWYGADDKRVTLDVREWHVVFRIPQRSSARPIGGGLYPSDPRSVCPGGDLWGIFWSSGCENGVGAAKRMDGGDWYAGTRSWFPEGGLLPTGTFYVQTLVSTGALSCCSFANDRGLTGGNVELCEAILFTGKTNTTARAEAIHAYLLNKWKGVGENPFPAIALDRVRIAAGGSLSLAADVPFAAATLAGGGRLDLRGGSLRDVATIEASIDADGNVEGTTVAGAVTLAQVVALKVKVADPQAFRGRTFTLFCAGSIGNVQDVVFDLQVDRPGGHLFKVRGSKTAIDLVDLPRGLTILVR